MGSYYVPNVPRRAIIELGNFVNQIMYQTDASFRSTFRMYSLNGGSRDIMVDAEFRIYVTQDYTAEEKDSWTATVFTLEEKYPAWRAELQIEEGIDDMINARNEATAASAEPKGKSSTSTSSIVKSTKGKYTSFAGSDIVASITLPPEISDGKPIVIGTLQTITYSTHRETSPVRTLGRINPVGFTSGARTIAGSLIFTVFDHNVVYDIQERILDYVLNGKSTKTPSDNDEGYSLDTYKKLINVAGYNLSNLKNQHILMDEMPPFDVTISMRNEYGNGGSLVIRGLTIVDEGQVMSIEDMITENTMSYMAMDIRPLRKED